MKDRYFDPLVDRLEMPVEVLVYTPREFEFMAERPFVKRALAEGIVAYESVLHGASPSRMRAEKSGEP